MTKETKAKPVHQVRLGNVKAAVWSKTNEQGRTRYDVSFSRSFQRDGSWKNSGYFGPQELPVLAAVLSQATRWIETKTTEVRQPESADAAASV